MKYNFLGKTGVLVSELCLGTMTFGGKGYWQAIGQLAQPEVNLLVKTAFDEGINFIDTANAIQKDCQRPYLAMLSKSWALTRSRSW